MKEFIIGRSPDADIRIETDPYVSPRHARAWQDEYGSVWVEDLGSTNGTRVNGARVITRTRIYPGDVVSVGRTDLPWRP